MKTLICVLTLIATLIGAALAQSTAWTNCSSPPRKGITFKASKRACKGVFVEEDGGPLWQILAISRFVAKLRRDPDYGLRFEKRMADCATPYPFTLIETDVYSTEIIQWTSDRRLNRCEYRRLVRDLLDSWEGHRASLSEKYRFTDGGDQ